MESPAPSAEQTAAAGPGSRMQRLRAALAARDWVGIAIELVVVTLGVLLAFEAQQWGEQLSRQRDEREFLERLYRETGAGTRELQQLVRVHQRAVDELGAVLRAEKDPVRLGQYSRRAEFGCVIGTLPSAAYNDTASEELVASGRIGTISDPHLRDAVRNLAAEQAEGEKQLDYGRENVNSMITLFLPYYRNELREGEESTRCTIDWPHLAADPAAATALARTYRVHQLMLESRKDTLAATAQVRRQIACTLGKGECGR